MGAGFIAAGTMILNFNHRVCCSLHIVSTSISMPYTCHALACVQQLHARSSHTRQLHSMSDGVCELGHFVGSSYQQTKFKQR